ncbi:SDR family NAD(P)-dependent oxidoreductase [Promicromonospora sp. NPDC060204]|uniref:SDR family NAD(P)-dependent oxidoreductase n=1 Tax=Promicromonospora sp. NPDC060204 TaxID=3347071 RepID=UPI00364FC8BA
MPFPFADVSATPLTDLLSLHGRRAVVTGGARGLGRAIAARLAEAGADVLLGDLELTLAEQAAAELSATHGTHVLATRLDVVDSASVDAAADLAVRELGGLDIWVNNAGVFPAFGALQASDEQWRQVQAVNLDGTFHGARAAARHFAASGGGVIVNVVSTAGFQAPAPGLAAYVASKHAVRGLTKELALELAPLGVRVLGVAPTFVPTEGNLAAAEAGRAQAEAAGIDPDAAGMDVMTHSLIGRLGTPDDIARVVLFAASDLSLIMTGSTLLADAGETI